MGGLHVKDQIIMYSNKERFGAMQMHCPLNMKLSELEKKPM